MSDFKFIDPKKVLEFADHIVATEHLFAAAPSSDIAIEAVVRAMCAALDQAFANVALAAGLVYEPPAPPPEPPMQTITIEVPAGFGEADIAAAIKRKLEENA